MSDKILVTALRHGRYIGSGDKAELDPKWTTATTAKIRDEVIPSLVERGRVGVISSPALRCLQTAQIAVASLVEAGAYFSLIDESPDRLPVSVGLHLSSSTLRGIADQETVVVDVLKSSNPPINPNRIGEIDALLMVTHEDRLEYLHLATSLVPQRFGYADSLSFELEK